MMDKTKTIIALTVAVFILSGCGRQSWRQKYSGNENDCREVTPEMLEILINPDKKVNRDYEDND